MLGTMLTVGSTFVMALPGGAAVPVLAYAVSGLGMGIASPALFAAVLAGEVGGREGRATSSIPLTRQLGSGTGAAVAGIVFAAALSAAQIAASEHSGAHVPAVVHAARLTYLAAGAVSVVGVAACFWLRRDIQPPGRSHERPAADVAVAAESEHEPAMRSAG
jgi:hypothetical protein